MSPAVYALHACALALLLAGLRELLFGFEENRCSMTYMFEHPEYRRIQLPRHVAHQYPAYGLYLYGEGMYAQETRGLKLTGAPVLFLPGNAGSYKQARSLGSVALRKAENMEGGVHMNVFTINFNEELVALYGGSLLRQTQFLHESIRVILRLYKNCPDPPSSVVLVGHSMGGVVARALFTLPRFNPRLVTLILTQASPHLAPVISLDPHILGKELNYQFGYVTAVPRTWVSTDHLSIVWCKELVLATVRAFFDLIEPETQQFTGDVKKRMSVLNHHFIRHPVLLPGDQMLNIYRMKVPWFREDSFHTAGFPSVTEISAMLHMARSDNTSSAILQLHTAPNYITEWYLERIYYISFISQYFPVSAVLLLMISGTSLTLFGSDQVPQKTQQNTENGYSSAEAQNKPKESNGSPFLSEAALHDVRDDLQLHLSVSTLLTLPLMLSAPSLIYWSRNLRYSVHLVPDPWWPHTVPLIIASVLLINCTTLTLSHR
uniref:GPI inositol-deacylase n=1 Tax=Astyanax mexicanus TaxID=7994 RepID=A0A8B9HGM5_ASTMX